MAGPRFAKVDTHLDSHPKVRRAGRNGREVFLFVLRKNAAVDRGGRVSASYVEPAYLADQLMTSESEARDGLDRAVAAGLLCLDDDDVIISGWDEDWSRRPLDDSERKARQRAKDKQVQGNSTDVDEKLLDVTKSNVTERDGSRMSRIDQREERREKREDPIALRAVAIAELAVSEINRLSGRAYEASSADTLANARRLAKEQRADDEILLVIRSMQFWLKNPEMAKNFRPSTLLRAKNFPRYLEDVQAERARPKLVLAVEDEPPSGYYPEAT